MRVLDYSVRYGLDGAMPRSALGMTGPAPTTEAELKAAVDIYDALDMYNKCVCIDQLTTNNVALPSPPHPFNTAYMNQRYLHDPSFTTMVKKGQIGAEFARAAATAIDMVPDRLWIENADGTRRNTKGNQTAALIHDFCFGVDRYDAALTARVPPRLAADGLVLYLVQEFDTPFNLTSVRVGPYAYKGISTATTALDAWVNGAWQQVLGPQTHPSVGKTVNVPTPVTASRFRTRRTFVSPIAGYEGCGLVLQSTDAKPVVALPPITWCIVIPMGVGPNDLLCNSVTEATGASLPVMAEIFTAGGPSDTGKEVLFSKASGLVSTDAPTFVGVTLSRRGLGE